MAVNPNVLRVIAAAARQFGLPPALLLGLAEQESGFRMVWGDNRTSYGVMQVQPRWWEREARARGWNIYTLEGNVLMGAYILASAIRAEGGNVIAGLRRYNGGPAWRRKPVTLEYATSVLRRMQRYGGARSTQAAQGVFPVPGGKIISVLGDPRDGGKRKHQGVDLGAVLGTPVLSFMGGKVTRAVAKDSGKGYGKVVYVLGADGREYRYAHLNDVLVRPGQTVGAGQPIGTVGLTGNARGTTPHLHFEVRESGKVLDPEPLLGMAGMAPFDESMFDLESERPGVIRPPSIADMEKASANLGRALSEHFNGRIPVEEATSFVSGLADQMVQKVTAGAATTGMVRPRRLTQPRLASEPLVGSLNVVEQMFGRTRTS